MLLHERIDWLIYLMTIVANAYVKKPLQLPPWLQQDEAEQGDDAMLAALYRLAERSKQLPPEA